MEFNPYISTFEEWLDANPEVRLEFPEPDDCEECLGDGELNCPWCMGTGCKDANLDLDVDCEYCSGEGKETCAVCDGYDPEDKAKDAYDDARYLDVTRLKRYNDWLKTI